jgi:hypothetical protein
MKLNDGLGIALNVIEERHEGHKSVCHGIRTTVLVEFCKHLKPLAIIQCPLVVEQEAKGRILGGCTDQALPESTRL